MKIMSFLAEKILNLLPYIFVFIASLYQPWDADLGWHLKYGEYFFQNFRVLKENIFSTEMPNFIWANTSWGVDLVYYAAFHLMGFLGLTILGALVVTLTFYFFSKAFDLDIWAIAVLFPFIIILQEPVNQISFRGQMLSVMMLGILSWILGSFDRSKNRNKLFYLPPLFLFWANLHGQFILGFGVLILWLFFYLVSPLLYMKPLNMGPFLKENISQIRFFGLIIALTFLATLIHPYRIGIYTETLSHFRNPNLQYIIEYLPFEELSQPWWHQMIFGIFGFLGLVYLFFSNNLRRNVSNIGVLTILYSLAWGVRRYAWSAYYLGIPLLKPLATFIKPDSRKITTFASLFLFLLYIFTAIYLRMPFSQFTQMNWDIYCAAYNNCSPKAVEFVRDNGLGKNLLSLYGWGGYMIWNYPEVKPSIDGRMHLWQDKNGYNAFSEYYALEQNTQDINDSKYDAVLMWKDKPVYKRLNALVEEGLWSKPYEDDLAGVFVRVKDAATTSGFLLKSN